MEPGSREWGAGLREVLLSPRASLRGASPQIFKDLCFGVQDHSS